jgi:peptidoglycan/xylan/chitin deacetylase (PgdA/CDA1 family)
MAASFLERLRRYIQRNSASVLFKRSLEVRPPVPLISFTFDDFPRTALTSGGVILHRHGLSGTYYTSLGLIGKDSPSGPIFVLDDLNPLLDQGHELGCHTFSHCNSWLTETKAFEDSIIQNQQALSELIPGAIFKSFSYPISEPRPLTKRAIAKHFLSCRAGGQTLNVGATDLNQLASFFLEKTRENIQPIKDLIDKNREARGWTIFSTHDIAPNPSPYGCTPEFFEEVVQYAVGSGARILPVVKALEAIRGAEVTA